MSKSNVATVYRQAVDDVVSNVRQLFVNNLGDDSALSQLQAIWELKLMQDGISIQTNSDTKEAGIPTPVHDLNIPYEGKEEYETPTADMLVPPTPLQMPIQTPLQVETGCLAANHGDNGFSSATEDSKSGRLASYMKQPSPWTNQRPLGVDVNVAYEEAREEEGGISEPPPHVKVNRTKSRWKCILRAGLMHLNERGILFTKANGDFDF